MNKSAIKNYAVWARNELIARVSQKAYEYGVTEKETPKYDSELVNGKLLSNTEKKQLNELISQVNKHGFNHVMEEVAYTWFNRFIALRFMEVNNYLPQKVNVFTDGNNNFKPQILSEAIHLEIDGVDKKIVFEFIEQNNQEELYKYLLLSACNDMNKYLPDMFTPITDYKALLTPDHLLNEGSVLDRLIKDIPEEDWTDQVQIIGWLYQYYIQVPKDELIHAKKQYLNNQVPFVTQLFTPDWIVRYMVENALGNYYMKLNPSTEAFKKWQYFINNKSFSNINENIETIKLLDPCMGSGHILAYAFDLFMEMYREKGYSDRDAAVRILTNNLYGLDIDERAYQLAYFSLMMKARYYNRRVLSMNIKPNIYCVNSVELDRDDVEYLYNKFDNKNLVDSVIKVFSDANTLGSLIKVDIFSQDEVHDMCSKLEESGKSSEENLLEMISKEVIAEQFLPALRIIDVLSSKYDVVITNPPYMSSSLMPSSIKDFLNDYYPKYKSDLFAAFIKKCIDLTKQSGYIGMVTPYVWMFISSYEDLRETLLNDTNISTLIQLEYNAFPAACVPVATFVLQKTSQKYEGSYIKLSDFKGVDNQAPKTIEAIYDHDCGYYYETNQENFKKMPGSPITYWASDSISKAFSEYRKISHFGESKSGMQTGNNNLFLRLWYEVSNNTIEFNQNCNNELSNKKWFPQPKGGSFRKWYGNMDYLVNFQNNGQDLRKYEGTSIIKNPQFYFKEGICWSHTTSSSFSARYMPEGCIFNVEAPSFYPNVGVSLYYVLGFFDSKILDVLFGYISQTMHYMAGDMSKIPLRISEEKNLVDLVEKYVKKNIFLSKNDWNSYETSWDFKVNPLIKQQSSLWDATFVGATIHKYYGKQIEVKSSMELCYHLWKIECNERFKQLKENEEELNRIFINIYGLQDELTPEVSDKDVTVHYVVDSKDDIPESFIGSNYIRTKQDEIKSFISYAVGCMFGRYSLDVKGLAYAGGEWDDDKYRTFIPDKDDIIPIYEDEFYGDDDITGRFFEFVKVAFGEENLEANLKFIADSLGGKGTPRKVIRDYFINDFFKDHCQMYQVTGSGKRPIYWQFDSGKKNGFKALVYIHRYKPDLIARMRTEYVHPQQARYRTQINMLENQIGSVSKSDEIRIKKEIQTIKAKADELAIYEEKIHHWADKMEPMDLDDGVVNNYNKFQELLVPNVVKKPKEK